MVFLNLTTLLVISTLCTANGSWTDWLKRTPRSISSADTPDDIQFDVPDLVTEHAIGDSKVTLEAFKVRNRTHIDPPKWVSVGYPSLMNNTKGHIFHFTPEHIMVFVKTLDPLQKEILFRQAKQQYPNANLSPASIIPLPLSQFVCSVQLYVDESSHDIRGSVYDLRRSPFLLKFPYNHNHKKRHLLRKRLQTGDPLHFECELSANGKQEKVNTLRITTGQIQQLGVADELLGQEGKEKYVLHQQLVRLSDNVKSHLHIEENYEIDSEEFGDQLTQKFLDSSATRFRHVPVDEALAKLSKYGIPTEQRRLAPRDIKEQLNSLLKIRNLGNRSIIVSMLANGEDANVLYDLVGASQSADFVNRKYHEWTIDNVTIGDQIQEINDHDREGIEWEQDGLNIVPKSLHVAKVSRASLGHQMDFSRIRKRISAAKYFRMYELSTGGWGHQANLTEEVRVEESQKMQETPEEALRDFQQQEFNQAMTASMQELNRAVQTLKDALAFPISSQPTAEPLDIFSDNSTTLFHQPESFLKRLKKEIQASTMTTCTVKTPIAAKRGISAKLWVPWDSLAFKNVDCGEADWYVTSIKWNQVENKSAEGIVNVLATYTCCPRQGGDCKTETNQNSTSGAKLHFAHVVDRYSSGRHVLVEVTEQIDCGGSEWYINGVSWDSFNESVDVEETKQVLVGHSNRDEFGNYLGYLREIHRTEVVKPRQEAYYLRPKYRCCKQWDWLPMKNFECGNGNWYVNDIKWLSWQKRNDSNGKASWSPSASYGCCSKEDGTCEEKIDNDD